MLAPAIWLDELAEGADFRQSEIQNLCVSPLGDEDVGGLDVAVDDSLGVGGIQCVGNLNSQAEQNVEFDGPSGNAMLQRHAVQKFHGDKRLGSALADLMNGANIGMIEGRGRTRFPAEAFQ